MAIHIVLNLFFFHKAENPNEKIKTKISEFKNFNLKTTMQMYAPSQFHLWNACAALCTCV